jgi:serine/threonine-protein kinase
VQELLDAALGAGLLSPSQRELLGLELTALNLSTCQDVAAQLIEKKVLTAFQAEQLLSGRSGDCVFAGRYQVLDVLGSGGMGTVYKAWDTKLERAVAIKVMAPHYVSNADAVARFHREAKALAKVSHSAIVQAYDAGEDRGRHFLVMEYVEGKSLQRLVEDHGRIPPTFAAEYIYQTAHGLQHAHERGLIHRDIKPSNLLLAGGAIKILDLGLARFAQDQLGEATLTREGMGMGTPDYMAPEQFVNARHADPRSDVYSLGCTLYHLLTGHVPFPGTSLAEKALAHEEQEPPPMEQRCPDAPAGLTLVAQRMMAKLPFDRFQSAREAAEAIAPYVATSSPSLPQVKATTSWHGSQLSVTLAQGRPKNHARLLQAGLAAAVVVLLGLLVFTAAAHRRQDTAANTDEALAQTAPPSREAAEPADPNVLTVSQEQKDGGQFRTINAALERVKPGQTIRVLDQAVYSESIFLNARTLHAGITLESPRRATLAPPERSFGITLVNVPNVTVRGFRLNREGPTGTFLAVVGARSPGTVFEELEFVRGGLEEGNAAVSLEGIEPAGEALGVIIRHCVFRGGDIGIRVSGQADYRTPYPCSGVSIRANTFSSQRRAIIAFGSLSRLQIVANKISHSTMSGIQLENLMPGTGEIVIANNSLVGCFTAFRLWDDAVKGQDIEFRNNLLLEPGPNDMVFIDSGGDALKQRGPGDGALVNKLWRLNHNWREMPMSKTPLDKSWIAPGAQDVRLDQIAVLSRDAGSPEFVRPAKDSPLASKGAGQTDPRLPSYVGAVPPEGVSAWDWDRTWRMPKDAQLLTVSQDEKDGGQFRTINEALKAATPWATVRVLDDATYREDIVLSTPNAYAGIQLEAPRKAKLEGTGRVAVTIHDVPQLSLRGFRITTASAGSGAVAVVGRAAGVVLEDLEIDAAGQAVIGISLEGLDVADDQPPVVVQNCVLRRFPGAIRLSAIANNYRSPLPGRCVQIRNNTIENAEYGIIVAGAAQQVQVVGNRIWRAGMAALQLETLLDGAEDILIANNTFLESKWAFRLWDEAVRGKNIEISNNLIVGRRDGADMIFTDSGGDRETERGPGDGRVVHSVWKWNNNWREVRTPAGKDLGAKAWIPPGSTDMLRDEIPLLSRDGASPDFLCPPANSPLATGGAGKDDPTLPTYVGAVPPMGVPAWDWDKTWRWRISRTAPPSESEAAQHTKQKKED